MVRETNLIIVNIMKNIFLVQIDHIHLKNTKNEFPKLNFFFKKIQVSYMGNRFLYQYEQDLKQIVVRNSVCAFAIGEIFIFISGQYQI